MPIPNVKPFAGTLPTRRFDERDPRALELFPTWNGEKIPSFGLIGVPYDGGVIGRKGAAGGPAAIREAFRFCSAYNLEEDQLLFGNVESADLGDIDVAGKSVADMQTTVQTALHAVWAGGGHPLILGGDNSLTVGSVRALAQSGAKRIGILDLDAHMDVRVPSPDPTSGTPYYQILESVPEVKPGNLVQVGLRRFANSKAYRDWAIKKGIRLFPMKEVRRRGFQGILETALVAALDGVEALYVSLDMDVVDQAWAPGVSSPSPDGLTPREVFDALQMAANKKECRGLEIVETAPNLDPTGNTARVAATAVLQYLVGRKMPTPVPKPEAPKTQPSMPPRAPPGPPSRGGFGRGPSRGPPRSGFGRGPPPRRF